MAFYSAHEYGAQHLPQMPSAGPSQMGPQTYHVDQMNQPPQFMRQHPHHQTPQAQQQQQATTQHQAPQQQHQHLPPSNGQLHLTESQAQAHAPQQQQTSQANRSQPRTETPSKAPYGSGDQEDGYTLTFPNIDEFNAWRRAEEEEKTVEFVKGDMHHSKADPPRFKEHTKLVCARHSRSGRKTYVKKHPERQRKVPSRKIEDGGCPASIAYKTYFNTDQIRVMYNSEHSHEIGEANLPFTRKGRKIMALEAKETTKRRRLTNADAGTSPRSAPLTNGNVNGGSDLDPRAHEVGLDGAMSMPLDDDSGPDHTNGTMNGHGEDHDSSSNGYGVDPDMDPRMTGTHTTGRPPLSTSSAAGLGGPSTPRGAMTSVNGLSPNASHSLGYPTQQQQHSSHSPVNIQHPLPPRTVPARSQQPSPLHPTPPVVQLQQQVQPHVLQLPPPPRTQPSLALPPVTHPAPVPQPPQTITPSSSMLSQPPTSVSSLVTSAPHPHSSPVLTLTSSAPSLPTHDQINQDRWNRMAVLFESLRTSARSTSEGGGGFVFASPSVAALESVLIKMWLESPVGSGGAG